MNILKSVLCFLTAAAVLGMAGCTSCTENPGVASDVQSQVSSSMSSAASKVESAISSMMPSSKEPLPSSEAPVPPSSHAKPSSLPPDGGLSAFVPAPDLSGLSELSNEERGWGQGVNMDEKNRPVGSVVTQEQYGCHDAYFIAPEQAEPTVYLTFDEGYENGYTSAILDVLKEKDVQAVFFVTLPYAEKNPELIQRMIDEGHAVGNHSSRHVSYPTLTLQEASEDFLGVHRFLEDNFDYEMYLFRFPCGNFSTRMLEFVHAYGYKSLFWSYAYKDYDVEHQPEPAAAYQKAVDRLHNGAIYLLHAVSSTNASILGDFIDSAREKGYTFDIPPRGEWEGAESAR